MCQADMTGFFESGWVSLNFSQGEEASSPWFGMGLSAVWFLEPQGNSIESSFSASLVALR